MIDVLSLAEEDTQLHKAAINEMAGPCPKCYGNDRFRVRHFKDSGSWRFMCRSCWDAGQYIAEKGKKRGWGDAIDYLRHYRGMTFQQAQAFAGEQEPIERHEPAQALYLSDEWQQSAHKAMQEHITRLWSDDHLALEYARGRGLYDHTIKQFQLGYSLTEGIPRLVIPNINDGHYTAIYRRDLRADVPHNERWKDAPGGGKDELYLSDCLYQRVDVPVVLCEDALSALSVYQECGDLVNVVATGGVKACMTTKWIARLACMPLVLVALDADPDGDKRAAEWLQRLKNGRRLRPLLIDANAMLMDAWNLREWVIAGLENKDTETLPCTDCDLDAVTTPEEVIFSYDEQGKIYCPTCWDRRQSSPTALQSIPSIPLELKEAAIRDSLEKMRVREGQMSMVSRAH